MKVALLLLFSLLELSIAATEVHPPPADTVNPHQTPTNFKSGDYNSNIPPAYLPMNDYPPKYPSSNNQLPPYQPANYSPPNRYRPTNDSPPNNYQPPSYRPTNKYQPQTGYYKPGLRNLNSVGGLSGLINLGLPGSVRQQYRPRYNPYAQQTQYKAYAPQAQYKPYAPQAQYPQQTQYKPYPPHYRAAPQQYIPSQQYPQTYRKYPGHYPRYPSYNYNPGVKDLSRYGGIRGLVRLGLPRTVRYN